MEEEKKRRNKKGIIRIILIAIVVFVIIFLILEGVLTQKLRGGCMGAYADIDDDGTVDGIIYADLAVGGSGIWNPSGDPDYDSYGEFTIPKETDGLKKYYVSQEFYIGNFGAGKVISPVRGTSGKDRFYVMALDDVDSDCHCWYHSAWESKINDYSKIAPSSFGSGKTNTGRMIDAWNNEAYGGKNTDRYSDVWGLSTVQSKYNSDQQWFVPSREEWAAFGYNLQIDEDESVHNLEEPIHSSKGLSIFYLSSSLYNTDDIYYADCAFAQMGRGSVQDDLYVRLSTTF